MKILIDIPEEVYESAKNGTLNEMQSMYICGSVVDGTPLPKRHGRLIDADALIPDRDYYEGGGYDAVSCEQIDNAPTIETDMSEYSDKLWKKAYERGKAEGRKTGRWIEHTSEEMSKLGFVKCSKCKAGFRRYERGVRHSDLPWIDGQPYELHLIDNFCPNCGADMRVKGGRE